MRWAETKASTSSSSSSSSTSTKSESKSTSSDSKPSASSDSGGDSKPNDSKHSSDIAFKPNNDGWGYTKSYSKGWDNIFGKKKDAAAEPSTPTPSPDIAKQKAALLAAKEVGALSEALYSQAMDEVLARAK